MLSYKVIESSIEGSVTLNLVHNTRTKVLIVNIYMYIVLAEMTGVTVTTEVELLLLQVY